MSCSLWRSMCLLCVLFLLTVTGCGENNPSPPVANADDKTTTPATTPPPTPAATEKNDREGWPTEAEAKAAIFKVEHAIHASQTNKDVWKVKDMKHEVKSVKFAQRTTQKQMNFGAQAVTVYPVKILYTRITDYSHKEATREESGADGVWFLYRDSFGEWTGKYGSE
ncbi:MAG: hypothetical protein WD768_00190 [Phycisphaeraceae bacterium]